MPEDPFSTFDGILSRMSEHDEALRKLSPNSYASPMADAFARYLPDGRSAFNDPGFNPRYPSLQAGSALNGHAIPDIFATKELATSPRWLLAHALDMAAPFGTGVLNSVQAARDNADATRFRDDMYRPGFLLEDRYMRPDLGELSSIGRAMQDRITDTYGLSSDRLFDRLDAVRHPWLNVQDAAASMMGFARLQGIGHLIDNVPTFDAAAASVLRVDFGDWRDPVTLSSSLGLKEADRTKLYLDRGFNPALTDFPAEAFDEGLEASGLQDGRPALAATYGDPVPASNDPEAEAAFARNNLVHDWLQRFESQIRKFIDEAMTVLYGSDWPRQRLPNGMFERWLEKQRRDISGSRWPLICYADFTDYEPLICRSDNWQAVFRAHFGRPELVRESLQRLYPTRLAAMHARPLMPEDELFAFAEIKRLARRFIV